MTTVTATAAATATMTMTTTMALVTTAKDNKDKVAGARRHKQQSTRSGVWKNTREVKMVFWRGSYDFCVCGVLLTKEKVVRTTLCMT